MEFYIKVRLRGRSKIAEKGEKKYKLKKSN